LDQRGLITSSFVTPAVQEALEDPEVRDYLRLILHDYLGYPWVLVSQWDPVRKKEWNIISE
jgi:hypothetical protein